MTRKGKIDVKAVRRILGVSQRTLARLIDGSVRSVRRWEEEGYVPKAYYQSQIQRLLKRHAAGEPLTGPRATLAIPRELKARLPEPSAGTGELRNIGIVPSSF